MIQGITNVLTNNTFVNIAQSTRSAMCIETALKATGRPTFIILDKNISKETKSYAAAKELIYQLTCLAVYMGIVLPVFRRGGFKLFKNYIFKDKEAFQHFKGLDEFSAFHKAKGMTMNDRTEFMNKKENQNMFSDKIKEILKDEKVDYEPYHIVKGADEVSSIIGSILGLAVLAPEVSHLTINPILRAIGLSKDNKATNKTLDKQA